MSLIQSEQTTQPIDNVSHSFPLRFTKHIWEMKHQNMAIPRKSEFLTDPEDLGQISAWKHFGGLSDDAAYLVIKSDPLNRLDDFYHMGSNAFCYYVNAAFRYLYETESKNNNEMLSGFVGVCEYWIDLESESIKESCLSDLRAACEQLLQRGDLFTGAYCGISFKLHDKLHELIDKCLTVADE